MDPLYGAILAFCGLCTGSFFNVLIWRIPRGENIAWPPSHCTQCGGPIKAYDNIPVVSYLILGGKCRHCKTRISPVYPLVEILTAAALVAAWHLLDIRPLTPWYLMIIPLVQAATLILLVPIAVIDIRHYIIPDRFTLTFLALALALSFVPGNLSPAQAFLGAGAGGGTLVLMGLIGTLILKKEDAMGMGDVKMMAWFGALWGWKAALIGIAFGALLGSIAGGIMILLKKLDDERRIPFGPFLGAGTAVAIFLGDPLLEWYLGLFS